MYILAEPQNQEPVRIGTIVSIQIGAPPEIAIPTIWIKIPCLETSNAKWRLVHDGNITETSWIGVYAPYIAHIPGVDTLVMVLHEGWNGNRNSNDYRPKGDG